MNDVLTVPKRPAKAQATGVGRPLRILHVLDHSLPLHSGYTFRTLAILSEQRALGWETYQLTGPKQGRTGDPQEEVEGWNFYRTRPARGMLAQLPMLKYRRLIQALETRLHQVVHAVQPDIIHAHSPVLNALPALAVSRAAGLPVVYEIRAFWEDAAADHGTAREWGPRYRLTRALETRAVRRADAVTTICEGLRGDLLKRGIPADKITVIPNAVDVAQFPFQTAPDAALIERYGLKPGATLGFAGSFYAYEGLDGLLRAMPLILRAVPDARLLLLGGGPQEANLKALAAHLGIEGVLHFIGRVPHSEVARYYSVMDVMVYPRITRRLTDLVTPLKPLEAMAMGKPVVASDVGGHRELIRDGHNGRLFPAGSAETLARCLIDVLKAPEAWNAMVSRGREYVECERTWRASVMRYQTVYAKVLDGA